MSIVAAYNLDGSSKDFVSGLLGSDTAISYSSNDAKVGQGAAFNGSTSRILSLRALDTFSFIQNTGVFSINIWLKRTAIGVLVYIMGNTPTSVEKGFFWGFNANNTMVFTIFKGVDSVPVLNYTTGVIISDTNWHMWTAIGNGTTVSFYRDNTLVATSGAMAAFSTGNSSRTLTISTISNHNFNFFNGSADIAYFYNHSLSAAERAQLYNNGNALQTFPAGTGFLPFFT